MSDHNEPHPFFSVVLTPSRHVDVHNFNQCVESLAKELEGTSCELICVSHLMPDFDLSTFKHTLLLLADMGDSRAQRRNVGWRAAQGRHISFTDRECLAASSARALLPALRACTDKVVALHHSPYPTTNESITEHNSVLSAVALWGNDYAVNRSTLETCDGFDSLLTEGEDIDLGIRLWEAGHTSRIVNAEPASYPRPLRLLQHSDFLRLLIRHPHAPLLRWYRTYSSTLQDLNAMTPSVTPENFEGRSDLQWLIDTDPSPDNSAARLFENDSTLSSILHFYAQTSLVPREKLQKNLNEALAQGILHESRGKQARMNFHLTSNWLRNRTTFYEELLQESFTRRYPTPYFQDGESELQTSIKYSGRYEIVFRAALLEEQEIESISNIPIPIACAAQSDITFTACDSKELLEKLNLKNGCLPDLRWRAGEPTESIAYEFTCTVHEVIGRRRRAVERDLPDSSRHLSTIESRLPTKRLRDILSSLRLARDPALDAAYRIYCWVIDNTKFGTSRESGLSLLDIGAGNCLDRTTLFIALCRMQGIPARERRGAVLQCSSADATEWVSSQVGLGFSPFQHAWAEFYVPELGWQPVEFLGQSFGKRSMTSQNVLSTTERERLQADTRFYDKYYFCNLDPHRIHMRTTSNSDEFRPRIYSAGKILPHADAQLRMQHSLKLKVVEVTEHG